MEAARQATTPCETISVAHYTIMELRRAADALLRADTSSLASFLAPPNLIRQSLQCQIRSKRNPSLLRRSFTTSSCRYDEQPPPSTSAKAPFDYLAKFTEKPQASKLASALWGNQPSRTASINPRSSASEMFANLHPKVKGMNLDAMLDMPGRAGSRAESELTSALDMDTHNSLSAPQSARPPPMRLNPSTGRTFEVTEDLDVARALLRLNQSCNQNSVRGDSILQRFHERNGMKRKRLRRQRWRRKFGEGFKAVVARVKELRNQGW